MGFPSISALRTAVVFVSLTEPPSAVRIVAGDDDVFNSCATAGMTYVLRAPVSNSVQQCRPSTRIACLTRPIASILVLPPFHGAHDLPHPHLRQASLVAPNPVQPFGAGRLLLRLADHAQGFDDAGDDVGVAALVAQHGPEPVLHRAEVGAGLR